MNHFVYFMREPCKCDTQHIDIYFRTLYNANCLI